MSDEEDHINPKSHKQLLQAISSLGKTQHIRKSTRDEHKLVQDEFQLVKGTAVVAKEKTQPVAINDIVQVLQGTKKHLDTGKELKKAVKSKKVLDKPLEKPAAERIKRTIGYENVKSKLAKWDAVVASNRSAETQVFPLKSETVYVNTSLHRKKPLDQSVKTDLMLQMEELENKYAKMKREHLGDTQDPAELAKREQELLQKKMTKEELIAKRKELAYLKMREAQKSIKARLQSKIKSKKYHKLLKKQKMQEQIKQFELLQKTNPEAAMEKLNALEKSRVLERASLRHKNTGTWAKNLQIRAKYDKDVRKDLSEQLQVSRQLTQKINDEESDEEDDKKISKNEEQEEDGGYDPFNPWTTVGKKDKNVTKEQEDQTNWRKYWLERNDNEKMLEEYKKLLKEGEEENVEQEDNVSDKDDHGEANETEDTDLQENTKIGKLMSKSKTLKRKKPEKKTNGANKSQKLENGWVVEEIDPASVKSIDDIFDAQEDRIREKLQKKLEIINEKGNKLARNKKSVKKASKEHDPLKNLKDLEFKNSATRPEIDEELKNEFEGEETLDPKAKLNETLEKSMSNKTETKENKHTANITDAIDPNKLATVKLKQHGIGFGSVSEAMGDVDMADEDDDPNADQQMTIAQAFEDDDIVADFSRDKTKDSELKDAEIQLSMPGWGSWAGAGISKEKMERRNKRLLLKLAPEEKRKDENKDGVYINEGVNKKLRTHLVSDVPFPFTSLKDYEASIRAPIGRNFVTETAFRLLTRPSVITQKGKVIEPMDESELVKRRPRKLRNPVDIRIAKMAEAK